MFKYWSVAIVVALIGTGVAGCSKDEGGGASENVAPGESQESIDNVELAEIQGTWDSNCTDADLFGLSKSSRLSIAGGEAKRITSYYSTGTCATEAIQVEQLTTVEKKDEVEPFVFGIDIAVSKVTIKPTTKTGASLLQLANFCGISDWTENVARDVTDKTGSERCFPKVPVTIYTIYSIEGDRMYFGAGEDLYSPALRPEKLNRDEFFVKR